ncbi:MAG TPA: SPOR domain-containing protein [Steroidobacteraceae bacterium]|jgi:cell division protein FtsN
MRHTGICLITLVLGTLTLVSCSRESADWKSASAADTAEAYQQFLAQHPKSANAAQAQGRIKQIGDDRDWQIAAAADTREAYAQFLAQHGDSKWAQEARIRVENFAQAGNTPAASAAPAAPAVHAAPDAPMVAARSAPGASRAKLASSASHGHYAQLGAFHSKAQAESQWKVLSTKYASELKSLTPHYVAAKYKGGTVYKLRVGVSSSAGAKDLCSSLKKHSQSCVPVTA